MAVARITGVAVAVAVGSVAVVVGAVKDVVAVTVANSDRGLLNREREKQQKTFLAVLVSHSPHAAGMEETK